MLLWAIVCSCDSVSLSADQCPYPSFHRIESFVKDNQKMKTVRFRYLCWGKIGLRDCFTFQILRERRVGTKFFNSTRRIWTDESLIFCEVSCESFNCSDQIKCWSSDRWRDQRLSRTLYLRGPSHCECYEKPSQVLLNKNLFLTEMSGPVDQYYIGTLSSLSIPICAVEDRTRISEHNSISFHCIIDTPPMSTGRSNWRFWLLIESPEGSTLGATYTCPLSRWARTQMPTGIPGK